MMSYYRDTLSSPTDGLQKIVVWLQSLGWTVNMSQAEGNGWRAHLSKGSIYVNLRAHHNEWSGGGPGYYNSTAGWGISLNLSTGYNASNAWHAQPGSPRVHYDADRGMAPCTKMGYQGSLGPLNGLYCFSDADDNIVIVIEGYPGIVGYLGWGNLIKAGTWTGGAYFFATRSSTAGYSGSYTGGYTTLAPTPFYNGNDHAALVRIDVDNTLGYWLGVGIGSWTTTLNNSADSTTLDARVYTPLNFTSNGVDAKLCPTEIPGYGGCGNQDQDGCDLQNRLFNAANSQHLFAPIHCYVTRAEGGFSLIGRVPSIHLSLATVHGLPLGAALVKGSDTYLVFPRFVVKKVA